MIACGWDVLHKILSQELDPTRRAVDLVTEYAREGSAGDSTVTDQAAARDVLGRLGLGGEKASAENCCLEWW